MSVSSASSRLRIVVVQGHRNTSGGNPTEARLTPSIANAVTAALAAAGHEAVCLQNDDGRADDWFSGSLDAVARRVMTYHRQRPVDLMLDIHLESDRANTPGVFAIVPDGDGLRTLTPYRGTDRATPASRDGKLGLAIAREVARTTGLRLRTRTVVTPGLMSERQTHVGADLGWRLAMFGYTAPARERMARIVLECGNIGADAAIVFAPGFAARVATGVVAGLERAGRPETPEAPAIPWPRFGTTATLHEARECTVAVSSLRARRYAETDQPILAEWSRGTRFRVRGWIIGEAVDGNPVWWITGDGADDDSRWRVWSGGTDLAGAAVLRLATR